ncbi:DUF4041 domain-containing protein [Flavobacterium sp. Sd200]|uniref:DUF4041 domain-containing protein n=1 Tax=Flavobacterium sp. Sd200 TaxID=2692211 RepID=UPI00137066DE|nr:DUF4041 domain-containing protein [Flavobacterium sp. Sd200]MXN90442.1 DUF4041 domain-containing protein [Flavobacterium sp. Sd200]
MGFVLFVCIVIIVVLFIKFNKLRTLSGFQKMIILNHEADKEKLKQEVSLLKSENVEIRFNNDELRVYQGIVDANKRAVSIINQAENKAAEIITNAQIEADEIKRKIKESKTISDSKIEALRANAENLIVNATKEAKVIIEQANTKAKDIAGDAFIAMNNAKELESTVRAMKNVIHGYGDQYLIPTYSLLDDLAKEFKYVDAGNKLNFAREKTRFMIKNGSAAKCDYVDLSRRETAIRFVLDAFNGKVESVFSKIKKDNYGTLQQQIKDAYQLVNNNGKAFRNAVITSEYLDARLDELNWAVVAQELKWLEQEEQRRIKEQIREEEKARREFEKAIKEAQKEEETLKRLIEKAQKEISFASDEQKLKYEQKLRELEEKLQYAESKNQRALSMAQQTKSGNVYIISNIGSFGENVFKIGMTRRLEPLDRVRELGDASVPFEFDVHAMIFSNDAPALERQLHKKFLTLQLNKINPRKEFFKVSLESIIAEIDKMNIQAKWTLLAAAKQYRESLIIEEEIANDKQKQLEWEKYQIEADAVMIENDEELVVVNTSLN